MLRTLAFAGLVGIAAPQVAQVPQDLEPVTAPTNEVFARMHHGHRVLMDLAQEVREKGRSPAAKRLAERVLRDHGARDRDLLAVARRHRIDFTVTDVGGGALKQAEADANRAERRLRAMTGDELDHEFAHTVVEIDRDLIQVAEDGARDAGSSAVRDHLDNTVSFLRGEIGLAERTVRDMDHRSPR